MPSRLPFSDHLKSIKSKQMGCESEVLIISFIIDKSKKIFEVLNGFNDFRIKGFLVFKLATESFSLNALLYRGSINIKLTKMESKKMSLMERRKQKLGGLQGTIKHLSCVENQLKVPLENGGHIHPHS